MSLPSSPPLVSDLATEVRRLADRLRALGPARLARPLPPHASVADAGRAVAQALADLTAPLELPPTVDVGGMVSVSQPGQLPQAQVLVGQPRMLPRLTDAAVGDQVAVCGNDLVAVLRMRQDAATDSVRQRAIELLRELRLVL
ncbi:MAG: hypothetical protein ABWZ26_01645 [Candidatus Nanopelagicales bacterium]